MVKVRGFEIKPKAIRDSHYRRAVQVANEITAQLGKIGVYEDDVDIEIEKVAMKKSPAVVTWYYDGDKGRFSYEGQNNYTENLYIIQEVLKLDIQRLLSDEISPDDFCRSYRDEDDIEEQRKEARELLGVAPDEQDFTIITKKYKALARKHHPDMEGGDHEMFQKINHAHKVLKKEFHL